MNQRGEYGASSHRGRRGPTVGAFGGALGFHTVGDRDALVEQTNTGWQRLVREFLARMGVDPAGAVVDPAAMARDVVGYTKQLSAWRAKLEQSPLYPFYRDVIQPEYSAFNKFYADQSSWEEFKTDWSTYVNWADRLEAMRASVNKVLATQNIAPLAGPGNIALPTTFTEEAGGLAKRGAEGAGEAAMDLVKIAKYAAFGVLAIGGVVALTSVASHLRKGTDPIQSYRRSR